MARKKVLVVSLVALVILLFVGVATGLRLAGAFDSGDPDSRKVQRLADKPIDTTSAPNPEYPRWNPPP